MKAQLSQKDVVKLGLHESSRGRSLHQIESDFHRLGISRQDSLKALDVVDHMKRKEEQNAARQKQAAKPDAHAASQTGNAAGAAAKKKSSLMVWILALLILLGIGYLFYERVLDMEIFNSLYFSWIGLIKSLNKSLTLPFFY